MPTLPRQQLCYCGIVGIGGQDRSVGKRPDLQYIDRKLEPYSLWGGFLVRAFRKPLIPNC